MLAKDMYIIIFQLFETDNIILRIFEIYFYKTIKKPPKRLEIERKNSVNYNVYNKMVKNANKDGIGVFHFHGLRDKPSDRQLRHSQDIEVNELIRSETIFVLKRGINEITYQLLEENKDTTTTDTDTTSQTSAV